MIVAVCDAMASPQLEEFVRRASSAEKEVESLLRELEALEPQVRAASEKNEEGAEVPEALAKLRAENGKLKYRLGILQRATEKELSRGKGGAGGGKMTTPSKKARREGGGGGGDGRMGSILGELAALFKEAVGEAFPDLPDAPAPVTGSTKFGDYQFNGAMAIAGMYKVRMP